MNSFERVFAWYLGFFIGLSFGVNLMFEAFLPDRIHDNDAFVIGSAILLMTLSVFMAAVVSKR